MFDLLSTAELTASSAIVILLLAFTLGHTARARGLVAAGLGAWFSMVLIAGATGAFSDGSGIGVAGVGLAVVLPVALLAVLVLGTAPGRASIRQAPLVALVGVHAVRILGISFILLYAAKRLPAPFAPIAGWGDIAVGLLALLLVVWLGSGKDERPTGIIVLWNALGLADLLAAVTLGATASHGPLQLFHGEPSASIMTSVPWILIPCFLVPALIFVHLCTFYWLRTMKVEAHRAAMPVRSKPLPVGR